MKKLFTNWKNALSSTLIGTCLLGTNPVLAEPTKGYYTMDAMGCMILRECTDGVKEVFSLLDISSQYENPEKFTSIAAEFNYMLNLVNTVGSKVYIADEKYFPPGHRGVYHTVSNNFYLNKAFMHRPSVLMAVMRHEGWHLAQDCMAGSIKNSMIAIIEPEESVPAYWAKIAKDTYPNSSLPWEREAMWAGHTEGMTAHALEACATGKMWEIYKPTSLTEKWLREEGFLK